MAIALERPKRDHKDLTRMCGANGSNMIELGPLNSVVMDRRPTKVAMHRLKSDMICAVMSL
jgi:hypothetical protein